jgi:hypothetical protein
MEISLLSGLKPSTLAVWHRRLFTATKRRLRSPAVQTCLPSYSGPYNFANTLFQRTQAASRAFLLAA